MKYKNEIDPELRSSARRFPFNEGVIALGNLFQDAGWKVIKAPDEIEEKEIIIPGHEGLPFRMSVFAPKEEKNPVPALLYVHGGAFSYKASGYQKKLALIYTKTTGCKLFFPHYHLAPKYPYPAAYEDVVSVYRYIMAHAAELGIDPDRIGVAGDSAGGSIAALVCNRWEKEKLTMPCLQMLMYPVTDSGMNTKSMKKYTDTPQWDAVANAKMWSLYCGDDKKLRESASPMHSDIPNVMPPTFIEPAEFDCLHDEAVLYAAKLSAAGVDVQLVETKGTYHGYDAAVKTEIVKNNIKKRIQFLKKGFEKGGKDGN